jgi:hypothetical protein
MHFLIENTCSTSNIRAVSSSIRAISSNIRALHPTYVLYHRAYVLYLRTFVLYIQHIRVMSSFIRALASNIRALHPTYVLHLRTFVLYHRSDVLCCHYTTCSVTVKTLSRLFTRVGDRVADGRFVLFQTRVSCCRCSICNSYNTTHNTILYYKVIPVTST